MKVSLHTKTFCPQPFSVVHSPLVVKSLVGDKHNSAIRFVLDGRRNLFMESTDQVVCRGHGSDEAAGDDGRKTCSCRNGKHYRPKLALLMRLKIPISGTCHGFI
jgi:hypothetical protein